MSQPPPVPDPLDDDDFDRIHADRRRARRKALGWLFGGFALLFALLAWGYIADEPPPDTSDLRVFFKRPPEDQNAYALLAKLVATLPPDPKETTPEERHFARIFNISSDGKERVAWDQAVVAAVLGRYAPDLADQIRAALAAPEYEAPEIKSHNDVISEIGRFRQLSRILTQQAALAWRSGDHAAATDLNLLALQLGQRVSRSQGPLSTVFTGTAIQHIAMDSIRRHADDPTITPAPLRHYLAQIGRLEIQIGDHHTALKVEHAGYFVSMAHALETQSPSKMVRGKPNKALDFLATLPGIYQPNRTIRWHADYTRACVSSSEPTPPGATDPFKAHIESIIVVPWHHWLRNPTGRMLLEAATLHIGHFTTIAHRTRANLRLTHLYVALRLYQLEHDGALPTDLAELVPAYLPAIPLDPFGGQPLRYDRALTTIWSIDHKHLTITDADGDFPEYGMPAYRLLFARPPVELPAYSEDPEPAP